MSNRQFDPSLIAVRQCGPKVLVMDKVTGRSVYVPGSKKRHLSLLHESGSGLTPEIKAARDLVIRELSDSGLGILSQPRFQTLNTLILKLTASCNYSCSYCYDFTGSNEQQYMDTHVALEALRQSLEICDGHLQVIFHGGEPFLAFELIRRIVSYGKEMASAAGKKIMFNGQTNLSLLTGDSVSFSEDNNIFWGFSLDGDALLNDASRKTKNGAGTHKRFLDAVRKFPRFVKQCGVKATITSVNHGSLLEMSHYFRSLGVKGWDWSLFQDAGRGKCKPFNYDAGILCASWNDLFDKVLEGEFDGFSLWPVLKYLENFIYGAGRVMCIRKDCGAARDVVSVTAGGDIKACDCLDADRPYAVLGNIRDVGIAEAMDSYPAHLVRSRNVLDGPCGDCIWVPICGGTCLAHCDDLNGINGKECLLTRNAYNRISEHLARSPRLLEYWNSCHESRT
ncbi:MAG: radical SAM protein [Nitrospirota bacterium]|nr:radical SAM protein [Nitrospirota bacterium]